MIEYVKGDILITSAEAVAHGVAPNDDFKQGLALSLRERWPAMYKDFRHFCQTTHPKEGTLWSWKGAGGKLIVNLFTQEHPKSKGEHPGPASLKYVRNSLRELAKEIEKQGIQSLAITRLATGVGGLEWTEVQPLLEEYLGPIGIKVYVYDEYHKDQQAQEH